MTGEKITVNNRAGIRVIPDPYQEPGYRDDLWLWEGKEEEIMKRDIKSGNPCNGAWDYSW